MATENDEKLLKNEADAQSRESAENSNVSENADLAEELQIESTPSFDEPEKASEVNAGAPSDSESEASFVEPCENDESEALSESKLNECEAADGEAADGEEASENEESNISEEPDESEEADGAVDSDKDQELQAKKHEMTEEEMLDARYLPRASVIFDENASDSEIPDAESKDDEPEIYSLRFFDEEVTEEKITIKKEEEPEEKDQEPYDPKNPRKVDARFDFVELFVFTLVFVLFVTSFIFRHSVVVGASMENTLFEGERLLISDLFYTPDYEDIIVFQDAETGINGAVVKRVIGLPGDVIEVWENGSIYRNGTLLIEGYVFIDGRNDQENSLFVVPEGEYFVMGDHRNNSEDSRSFGTIKEDSILGRVLIRFYPFDRFGKVE